MLDYRARSKVVEDADLSRFVSIVVVVVVVVETFFHGVDFFSMEWILLNATSHRICRDIDTAFCAVTASMRF